MFRMAVARYAFSLDRTYLLLLWPCEYVHVYEKPLAAAQSTQQSNWIGEEEEQQQQQPQQKMIIIWKQNVHSNIDRLRRTMAEKEEWECGAKRQRGMKSIKN